MVCDTWDSPSVRAKLKFEQLFSCHQTRLIHCAVFQHSNEDYFWGHVQGIPMPWGTQTRQLSFIGLSHFDLPFNAIVTPLNSMVVPGIILVEITTVCIYKLPGIWHHCICNYRESVIDVILAKWHHLHNLLTGRNAEQVNDVQWSIEWVLVWVQLSTYLCPRMMQAVGSGSWIRVSLVIIWSSEKFVYWLSCVW